jgi:transposase-like protein
MDYATHLFRRRRFDRLIIVLCVRWYVSYKLSYRDLVEMMAAHEFPHTTKLYDRTNDQISLDEVERILLT